MGAALYAQIGGLAIATVITRLLVPVFYAIAVKDLKMVRWEARAWLGIESPSSALASEPGTLARRQWRK